jgi:hypothetical protein
MDSPDNIKQFGVELKWNPRIIMTDYETKGDMWIYILSIIEDHECE